MTTIATTVTTQRPDFGALVRTWRNRARLTRYALAVRCCWEPDVQQVAAIEQGEPIQVEEHQALALIAALGIPPEELVHLGLLGVAEAAVLRLVGSVGLTITDPDTGEVSVPLTVDQLAELAGLAVELAKVARSLRPGLVPEIPERPAWRQVWPGFTAEDSEQPGEAALVEGRMRWLLAMVRCGDYRPKPAPTPTVTPTVYRVSAESGDGDRYFCSGDECGHGL
jgi:transcriptional regulator with XRE-family HTH domain